MWSLLWAASFQVKIFRRYDRIYAEHAACHFPACGTVAESGADDVAELDHAAAAEASRCVHRCVSVKIECKIINQGL